MEQASGPRIVQGPAEAGDPATISDRARVAVRRSRRSGLPLPTSRAIVAAAIPSVVVFLVFWRWLGFTLPLAASLGVVWAFASLLVTRSVYDDAELELAAWREAAPELAMRSWSAAAEQASVASTPPDATLREPDAEPDATPDEPGAAVTVSR